MRAAIRQKRLIKSEQLNGGSEVEDYSNVHDRRGHSVILKHGLGQSSLEGEMGPGICSKIEGRVQRKNLLKSCA